MLSNPCHVASSLKLPHVLVPGTAGVVPSYLTYSLPQSFVIYTKERNLCATLICVRFYLFFFFLKELRNSGAKIDGWKYVKYAVYIV